jgi:GDPmannose 4,6-dehydratase
MFGTSSPPQNEVTPFHPRSPYGIAKVAAHWFATNYREAYGMFVCNGILFNHESPRRDEMYVTRKVTRAIARIKAGKQQHLYLGNLAARRDWGYAGDYVEAMWLMLQQDKPGDYVIATGEARSVQDWVREAFACADLHWADHVKIAKSLFRPTEVDHLLGDATRAKHALKWRPKVGFKDLVRMMVDADMALENR